MQVSAIVVAAGKGKRLKSKISKSLVMLGSSPVIVLSLRVLSSLTAIKDIIIVANPGNLKAINSSIRKYRITKIKDIVLGGVRRQDSVVNGLKMVSPKTEFVLIHDAARPFINKGLVSKALNSASKFGAAIVGVPVKATVKRINGRFIAKTIERNHLWEVQTPQVFRRALILEAYRRFGKDTVTDDAALVEKLGRKVKIVKGSYFNIKITTPEDLVLARAIAKEFV